MELYKVLFIEYDWKNFEHFVYIMLYRFAVTFFFFSQIPIIRSDLEAREKAEEEEEKTIPVKTEQDGRRWNES